MKFSHFFRYSWIIQLLVGISLFTVSFLIENQVLQTFIAAPSLALLLAVSLEAGKAAAIVWHRYMSYQVDMGYPTSIRYISGSFRAGLLILSMLCSLLFLAENLDRPNLDKVRTEEISRSKTHLEETLKRIDTRYHESLEHFKQKQTLIYKKRQQDFSNTINQLDHELTKEMGNVIHGTFVGPRYTELESRIKKEKKRQSEILKQLAHQQENALTKESERLQDKQEKSRQLAYDKSETKRNALIDEDFADDERANDAKIVSFLKVLESVFSADIQPLQFVFLFSLLLSILTELGIVLAFDTVTLSILPALKSGHETDIHKEIIKNEMEVESQQDNLRQQAAFNRINNSANEVINKAEEYMDISQINLDH